MDAQTTSRGSGIPVALAGALAGDLLLGAVATTPYFVQGARPGELAVTLLFGTYFGFTRPYSLLMHLGLWLGAPAGAWIALRNLGFPGAGWSAITLALFQPVLLGAAVLIAILNFGDRPLIYFETQSWLVVLAILVLAPVGARAFFVWRTQRGPSAALPAAGAH